MLSSLTHRFARALAAFVAPFSPVASESPAPQPVQSRAQLEREASAVLGEGYSFTGLSEREIHERVLAAVFRGRLNSWGKSDEWVRKNYERVMRQRAAGEI